MVTTSGNLFHIDFGHFLGNIKYCMVMCGFMLCCGAELNIHTTGSHTHTHTHTHTTHTHTGRYIYIHTGSTHTFTQAVTHRQSHTHWQIHTHTHTQQTHTQAHSISVVYLSHAGIHVWVNGWVGLQLNACISLSTPPSRDSRENGPPSY